MLKKLWNKFFGNKAGVICPNCGYHMLIQSTEKKRVIGSCDIIDFEVSFWYCSFCNTKRYVVFGDKVISQ
jgi:hypothetical protein